MSLANSTCDRCGKFSVDHLFARFSDIEQNPDGQWIFVGRDLPSSIPVYCLACKNELDPTGAVCNLFEPSDPAN